MTAHRKSASRRHFAIVCALLVLNLLLGSEAYWASLWASEQLSQAGWNIQHVKMLLLANSALLLGGGASVWRWRKGRRKPKST